jgi:hypothetical protein
LIPLQNVIDRSDVGIDGQVELVDENNGSSFYLPIQAPEVLFLTKKSQLVDSLTEAIEQVWSMSVQAGRLT